MQLHHIRPHVLGIFLDLGSIFSRICFVGTSVPPISQGPKWPLTISPGQALASAGVGGLTGESQFFMV